MGADHRPLAAFVVIAIIAAVLLVTSVRSQAESGWLQARRLVAAPAAPGLAPVGIHRASDLAAPTASAKTGAPVRTSGQGATGTTSSTSGPTGPTATSRHAVHATMSRQAVSGHPASPAAPAPDTTTSPQSSYPAKRGFGPHGPFAPVHDPLSGHHRAGWPLGGHPWLFGPWRAYPWHAYSWRPFAGPGHARPHHP